MLGTPPGLHLLLTTPRFAALVTPLRLVSGLSHAALYGGLLILFGRSLLPGREALVTGLARRYHRTLPASVARYTRGVTWAWALFGLCQLAGSALLLLFAPARVWSLFVNVLDLPLVAAMFAAEFGCRVTLLPPAERVGPIEAIRAFARRDTAAVAPHS